ncbi:MAG TPA: hypothetical protein VN922_15025, partial [Bacteroidia bacterium]|nr:hypothetical protein [Bacteroidia bacterium]
DIQKALIDAELPIITVTPSVLKPEIYRPEFAILLDAEPERALQFAKDHAGCVVFIFMTCKPEFIDMSPDYSEFLSKAENSVPEDPDFHAYYQIVTPFYVGNFDNPMDAINKIMESVIKDFNCSSPPKWDPVYIYDERPKK